jgi:5-methylcytosine-specific restriction endonuclease McrA
MTTTYEKPQDRKPLTRKQKAELALRQDGKCPVCGQKLGLKGTELVDVIDEHLVPLWSGGSNDLSNRALLCVPCAKVKTAKEATDRGKSLRIRDKHLGIKTTKSKMPFGKGSRYKRKLNGAVVLREED